MQEIALPRVLWDGVFENDSNRAGNSETHALFCRFSAKTQQRKQVSRFSFRCISSLALSLKEVDFVVVERSEKVLEANVGASPRKRCLPAGR